MIRLYNEEDFEGLRKAGKLAAELLDYLTDFVVEGVSTLKLDDLAVEFIRDNGATSACLNYEGFPKSICTSVNHVVCHGIPSEKKILHSGDIINIDVTVILNGYYGDTSRMFYAGEPTIKGRLLTETCYESMWRGINQVKAGVRFGDIGEAIQTFVEAKGFSDVRDYVGHGIGKVFHDAPWVKHYGKAGTGEVMTSGMVFTIEPMINVGDYRVLTSKLDGWTVTTKDKSLSAQFEHTMGIKPDGMVEIFTLSPKGYKFPPYK